MARYESDDAIIKDNCRYGGVQLDEETADKKSYQNLKSLLQERGFENNCLFIENINELNVGNVMRVKRWGITANPFT